MSIKERRTKRQRRGTNPDLDQLNMSDEEIRMAEGSGTGPFGIQDRLMDRARIKGVERVLLTIEPPERPAACSDRNEPQN